MPQIAMPHLWHPRVYQEKAWGALENGIKRVVLVWHRRTGKDLTALNWIATEAFRRPGMYWHLLPTFSQGRRVIWEGMDHGGRPFLDAFPKDAIKRKLEQQMQLELHGGSKFQVVGSDEIDRLVGANPVGLVMSEYPLQNPAAWELLSPIIASNDGFVIFPYTPRGHNHGWDLLEFARGHKDRWFSEILTVDDTNIVPPEMLAEEKEMLPKEIFEQEYYCSFNASLVGAYYKEQLAWMETQDPPRISDNVSWLPNKPVICGWDLGFADMAVCWFAQVIGSEIRIIDFEQASGRTVDAWAKVLREKPYTYDVMKLPYDSSQHTMLSQYSVEEQFTSLGFNCQRPFVPIPLHEQHATVRLLLRQCWIHKTMCKLGISALREYTKKPVPGQRGPNNEQLYQDVPLHNWASHPASGLATLLCAFQPEDYGEFKQPDASYVV